MTKFGDGLLLDLRTIDSGRLGSLSFLEAGKDIPFDIKRIYYTYGVEESVKRGGHAHKELQQVLICPYGVIEVLLDDGQLQRSFVLDTPNKGLLVDEMVWHDMIWKQGDSVLLVAASDCYEESDYIRNYETFLDLAKKRASERRD